MSAAATETESGHAKNAKVSHGRGGAANIGEDDTLYLDGGIIREGAVGDQGDGPYSTGRGGLANIGTPKVKAAAPADQEVIPETALRDDKHEVFHTGRGGEGNLHHENSRLDDGEKSAHHGKHHDHGDHSTTVMSEEDTNASSHAAKAKKGHSFFGRKKHTTDSNEAEEAMGQEKEDTGSAENEKRNGAPTHNGLGDKLKYKIFGKLYD